MSYADIAQSFNRAASGYDELANVQHQVADNLLCMVDSEVATASTIVDLGCGTGRTLSLCRQCNESAELVGVDISSQMLARAGLRDLGIQLVERRLEATGLLSDSFDLVVSSSAMQWADVNEALKEAARLCSSSSVGGGVVAVACFLTGTLKSWREVWGGVHQELPDSVALLDAAVLAGLDVISSKLETIVERCGSYDDALASVKGIGAGNSTSRNPRFINKVMLKAAKAKVEQQIAQDGSFPMEYEVLYLIARKRRAV